MQFRQQVAVRRVILPLRHPFLDRLVPPATQRHVRSRLDYTLEALERRIVCTAGELDPSFGSGGLLFPNAPSGGTVLVSTGADGHIVLGTVDTSRKVSQLQRYTSDGQLDASFGTGGVVTFEFTPDSGGWGGIEEFADLIVLPNGKVVAMGNHLAGNSTIQTSLHAFNADGSADTSFGANSVVLLDNFGWPLMRAGADGRIFVFGAAPWTGTQDGMVVCLNGDGSLDTTFGDQGRVRLDFGAQEEIRHAAIGPNGEIVIVLSGEPQSPAFGFHVVRLTPAGQFDPTFGQGGRAIVTTSDGRAIPDGVRVMSDGRIVIVGAQYGAALDAWQYAFVMRLNTDGSPDTTFGDGGTAERPLSSQLMEVQADGKIIFASARQDAQGAQDTFLTRLTADGRPDETFGEGGQRVHDFDDQYENVSSLRLTVSGDILIAGTMGGAVALAQFDAGELSEPLPSPAEPPPPAPPAPQADKFNDVQPVRDVADEAAPSLIRPWSDDLLHPDPDDEDLLAGLV